MKKSADKDRDDKDKKKKEKKEPKKIEKRKVEKPLTQDELKRLEDARRSLLKTNGSHEAASMPVSDSNDSLGSSRHSQSSREMTPDGTGSKQSRHGPPTHPKPKKSNLKDKSAYGPDIPNQGVHGNPADSTAIEQNTLRNELMTSRSNSNPGSRPQPATIIHPNLKTRSLKSSSQDSTTNARSGPPRRPVTLTKPRSLHPKPEISVIEPPSDYVDEPAAAELDSEIPAAPPSPAEKIYANVDLQLPTVAPPRAMRARKIELKRLPAGDFGFSLRKGTVLERGTHADTAERKHKVIFAEPGAKNLDSGLLPGDRLLAVNDVNVEQCSREELIEIIRDAGATVTLTVQPIPELSELSMRSGVEGEDVSIAEHSVKTGTLQRTGSMRYKSRQVGRYDALWAVY